MHCGGGSSFARLRMHRTETVYQPTCLPCTNARKGFLYCSRVSNGVAGSNHMLRNVSSNISSLGVLRDGMLPGFVSGAGRPAISIGRVSASSGWTAAPRKAENNLRCTATQARNMPRIRRAIRDLALFHSLSFHVLPLELLGQEFLADFILQLLHPFPALRSTLYREAPAQTLLVLDCIFHSDIRCI